MSYTSRRPLRVVTLLLSCVVILTLSCSKSGTGGMDQDDDSYPAAITDLRVKSVSPTAVTLEWTATGNDTTSGTAVEYDLRYSKNMITYVNWDSTIQVTGEPRPKPSGATDTMRIAGLMPDSTYYFALKARSSSGNWSWLSNCVNAVCFENYEVIFPDQHLSQVIRTIINKPTGPILRADLLPVTEVISNEDSVANLSGLENCLNLQSLFLWKNLVSDVTPLSGLTKLRGLQLGENRVTNISPFAGLINLQQLILNDNGCSDISALKNLTKLSDVNLAGNGITDISALAGKPEMTSLVLERNAIVETDSLIAMVNLGTLNLQSNQVTSLKGLSGMTKLVILLLYDNKISDVSQLTSVTSLEYLILQMNSITDISALTGMTKLKGLNLLQNQIVDISPLAGMTGLQWLYLSFNPIANINPVAGLTSLTDLQLQYCELDTIAVLQGLVNLQKIVLYHNHITDLTPLVNNTGLGSGDIVYLTGNPLTEDARLVQIPLLTDRGVTVYF
jgi:Leucine-rich repeat (LRR) protein